jgi:ABC-type uncharacterized transport system permease subunit
LANLVKPYSVTVEVVRHSNPDGIGASARRISTANVGRWWAAYLIAGVVGWLAGMMFASGVATHSIDSMMTGIGIAIVGKLISIIAAVFAILLVAQVDKNQERRFQLVSEQEAAAPRPGLGGYPF